MLVLLGSHALNHYTHARTPIDMDLLGTYDDCRDYIKQIGKTERILSDYPDSGGDKIVVKTDKNIYEFEVAWPDSNAEGLLNIIENDQYTRVNDGLMIPTHHVLYMLKMSHRYKKDSPHFLKTMRDIQLLREFGAKIPEKHIEWFKERERLTYLNTLPKLNQSKKSFFNETVPYTYDHDTLHLAVMFKDRPAYTFFKEDQSEVMVSKKMFFNLPREIQLLSVVEEAMVLAIERALVPFPEGMNPKQAFDFALAKVCTSISSGWWREFAYDNYDSVQEMYDPTYFERFNSALSKGVVMPYRKD